MLCAGVFHVQAQDNTKDKRIQVSSVITNEAGQPVDGADIYAHKGFAKTKSDRDGKFTINVAENAILTIDSKGYKSTSYAATLIPGDVILARDPMLYGDDADVTIAYQTVKQGDLINQTQFIKTVDEDGLIFSNDLTELVQTRVAGLISSNNIRGLGNALVVVDGVPRYKSLSSVYLLPEEVASISFLNSVSAAVLYGSEARNGAIVITTKRGKPNTQNITIRARYGVSVPKNLPQFLGSADYMTLYNEALTNDGLSPIYSDDEIAKYRSGENPYRYADVDYYSSDYVKKLSTNSRVDAEFSGGGDNVTYYSNLGWEQNHNFINFGPAKSMPFNRFNARTNVSFKINDIISNTVLGSAVFNFNKSPRTNYFSSAASLRPNQFVPLLPIALMDRNNENINALIEGSSGLIDGKYLLGGSSLQKTNPFADIYAGGYNQDVERLMEFTNILNFDFNKHVKGLTASANISFDFYNGYSQNVSNGYAVYEPQWSDGKIVGLNKFNEDKYTGILNVGPASGYRRFGFSGQVNYTNTFFNVHTIDAMVIASGRTYFGFTPNANGVDSNKSPDKFANLGMRLAYNYKQKYYIDFSSSLSNSVKLAPGNRIGFSPTLAVAYNLTKEPFLSDVSWLDYLKVSASAGIIQSDLSIPGYFSYENVYYQAGGYYWNEKNQSTSTTMTYQGYNPNLSMEKRKEINIGFDALMFNNSLQLFVNYFDMRITDKIGKLSHKYPTWQSNMTPYGNEAGTDRFYGAEIGVNYIKQFNDFGINVGVVASLCDSKVISRNDFYAYDYLSRVGRPVSGLYMLEADGLFSSQQEIDGSAQQLFGTVKPGDIKYKDQNGDDIIDSNDVVYVGRGGTPVNIGLNLGLSYKNFSLFANGYYSSGGYSSISGSYYRMSGDNKYSVIANQRWTEATKESAKYPRLSSVNATNNGQASTFWVFKNKFFNLSRVQLNYSFAPNICRTLALGNLDVYVTASDVALYGTQNSYRNQSTGDLLTRTFSIGFNATF